MRQSEHVRPAGLLGPITAFLGTELACGVDLALELGETGHLLPVLAGEADGHSDAAPEGGLLGGHDWAIPSSGIGIWTPNRARARSW